MVWELNDSFRGLPLKKLRQVMDQSFTKRGLAKETKKSLQESWLCQPWTVLSWQVYSPQDNGCFSETQSQNLFLQLMTAVAYMHLCSQKVGRWLSFAMGIWWSMLNMWWEIVDPKSLQNQEMPRFSDEISADICFHLTFPFQKTPRVEKPEALQEGNSQRHQGRKSIHFVSRYRLVYGWRIWDHSVVEFPNLQKCCLNQFALVAQQVLSKLVK